MARVERRKLDRSRRGANADPGLGWRGAANDTDTRCPDRRIPAADPLRGEEVADLVHERLGARIVRSRVLFVDRFELAQELFLPRSQVDGGLERDVAVEIA